MLLLGLPMQLSRQTRHSYLLRAASPALPQKTIHCGTFRDRTGNASLIPGWKCFISCLWKQYETKITLLRNVSFPFEQNYSQNWVEVPITSVMSQVGHCRWDMKCYRAGLQTVHSPHMCFPSYLWQYDNGGRSHTEGQKKLPTEGLLFFMIPRSFHS